VVTNPFFHLDWYSYRKFIRYTSFIQHIKFSLIVYFTLQRPWHSMQWEGVLSPFQFQSTRQGSESAFDWFHRGKYVCIMVNMSMVHYHSRCSFSAFYKSVLHSLLLFGRKLDKSSRKCIYLEAVLFGRMLDKSSRKCTYLEAVLFIQ
jgi:hypothetical protein